MKNNCTLICDFNWLTISRFSVINKGFDKNLPEVALNEAKEELKDIEVVITHSDIVEELFLNK